METFGHKKPDRYFAPVARGPWETYPAEIAKAHDKVVALQVALDDAINHNARLLKVIRDLCDPKPGCWQAALKAGRAEIGANLDA